MRTIEQNHIDKRGNRDLIAVAVMNMVLYLFTYLFYTRVNKRRDRIWDSWTAKASDLDCSPMKHLTCSDKQQQEYLDSKIDEVSMFITVATPVWTD